MQALCTQREITQTHPLASYCLQRHGEDRPVPECCRLCRHCRHVGTRGTLWQDGDGGAWYFQYQCLDFRAALEVLKLNFLWWVNRDRDPSAWRERYFGAREVPVPVMRSPSEPGGGLVQVKEIAVASVFTEKNWKFILGDFLSPAGNFLAENYRAFSLATLCLICSLMATAGKSN